MVRLSRAQRQERTRATVLAAARAEFTERGYAAAKVDEIAERAELTRGAVYSNFPSKRALYLAVLLDTADTAGSGVTGEGPPAVPSSPPSLAEALGAFARARLQRLPLVDDAPALGQVRLRSLAGVLDDEPIRTAFAQLTRLEALLLALALESRTPAGRPCSVRQVRRAELVLRLLDGPGASVDPGLVSGDPFDLAQACAHLGDLALADTWDPPHLPYIRPAQTCLEPWTPPGELRDLITGRPVGFDEDGVVVVLGSHRLEAVEESVRAARAGDRVTVAVATADPAETGRLVTLRIDDFARCLRGVFAQDGWPRLRVVLDDGGLLASAIGVADADDTAEHAVRVQQGTLVARAHGRGAGHAAAGAPSPELSPAPAGHARTHLSDASPDGTAP
ncbi:MULTISPECIES: TetR/AcrR family transcriptional regulator [unclassified Streptomyces]|uniref:TetR/AcrR family transcriptional regulator n=1 Tax=unclassified Streptomyces TaxID=2593676 RepID=UPI00070FBAE6|nr:MULTISPECIES: TetR/AcrR family transcriptional regulator [unclassified Streptomyces]KRD19955.1 transcriptional regulator [Streptomyces sp. Root264]